MASVPDTFELLEDITNFLGLEENPYFFKLKDELQTFPDNMISRITQKLNEIVEDEPFKFKTYEIIISFIAKASFLFQNY